MNNAELEAAVRDGLVDAFAMMDETQRRQTVEKLEEYQALRDILFEVLRQLKPAAAGRIAAQHRDGFIQCEGLAAFADLPAWVAYMQTMEVMLQEIYTELAGDRLVELSKRYPTYFRPMQILNTAELRDLTVKEGVRIAKEIKAGVDTNLQPDEDHARRLEQSRQRVRKVVYR